MTTKRLQSKLYLLYLGYSLMLVRLTACLMAHHVRGHSHQAHFQCRCRPRQWVETLCPKSPRTPLYLTTSSIL